MAAHAASTASLWSIAAVLACDRCDGVQGERLLLWPLLRKLATSGGLRRARSNWALFPIILQPRRRLRSFFAQRRVEQLAG